MASHEPQVHDHQLQVHAVVVLLSERDADVFEARATTTRHVVWSSSDIGCRATGVDLYKPKQI